MDVVKKIFESNRESGGLSNPIFSLHSKLTSGILIAFMGIYCLRKGMGTPMACMPRETEGAPAMQGINSYCWTNSYIVMPRSRRDNVLIKKGYFHPVRTPALPNATVLKDPSSRYRPVYLHAHQWFEFILLVKALLFLLPRFLWKYCFEDKRVSLLRASFLRLNGSTESLQSNTSSEDKIEKVVYYLRSNRFNHLQYSLKFVFCEVLNFINVLTQLLFLLSYMGVTLSVIWTTFMSESNRAGDDGINTDMRMSLDFPDMARCETPAPPRMASDEAMDDLNNKMRGAQLIFPNGTRMILPVNQTMPQPAQPSARYCMLPINSSPKRMLSFLVFYYLGLTIISGLTLFFYRFVSLFSPRFRLMVMKRTVSGISEWTEQIVLNLSYGEWFVLSVVMQDMDPFVFENILEGYRNEIFSDEASVPLRKNVEH